MCLRSIFTLHKLNRASTHIFGLTKFYCNICQGNGYEWPVNCKRNWCRIIVLKWNCTETWIFISVYAASWTVWTFSCSMRICFLTRGSMCLSQGLMDINILPCLLQTALRKKEKKCYQLYLNIIIPSLLTLFPGM